MIEPHISSDQSRPPGDGLRQVRSHEQPNLQSIQDNWQNLLAAIRAKLGAGTSGLLSSAKPVRLEEDILTLEFDSSTKIRMCESNGKAEQIRTCLSEQLSAPIGIRFEVAANEENQGRPTPIQEISSVKRRNELINDPAVKTILLGLDATITDIEED